jgi:hypothetical protein
VTLTTLDQAQVSEAPPLSGIPALAEQIIRMRAREQVRLHRIAKYMRGEHDSVYVPEGARKEYEWLRERSVVNFLPLIVSVVSENLHVDGYRSTRRTQRWSRTTSKARGRSWPARRSRTRRRS